jgi:dimeric dUTPase (all-alpha-NTP-PPase superfamily)
VVPIPKLKVVPLGEKEFDIKVKGMKLDHFRVGVLGTVSIGTLITIGSIVWSLGGKSAQFKTVVTCIGDLQAAEKSNQEYHTTFKEFIARQDQINQGQKEMNERLERILIQVSRK